MPASPVVTVMQTGDKQIAESSRCPVRHAATAGYPEVDLTDKASTRAADNSASTLVI
jgi:hypothetical protein